MPATPLGKISRRKALALLVEARKLIGTIDDPAGPHDPELDVFIRSVRAREQTNGRKTTLFVVIRFKLSPLPKLSPADRSDFSYVLLYDAHRRLTELGIEFDGYWSGTFATKRKSRRKVEKMIDLWKHGHVRPASAR